MGAEVVLVTDGVELGVGVGFEVGEGVGVGVIVAVGLATGAGLEVGARVVEVTGAPHALKTKAASITDINNIRFIVPLIF